MDPTRVQLWATYFFVFLYASSVNVAHTTILIANILYAFRCVKICTNVAMSRRVSVDVIPQNALRWLLMSTVVVALYTVFRKKHRLTFSFISPCRGVYYNRLRSQWKFVTMFTMGRQRSSSKTLTSFFSKLWMAILIKFSSSTEDIFSCHQVNFFENNISHFRENCSF